MKFQRNSEVVATEMDGSLMMMSIELGKYFELNPVSKRIWELLETPVSLSGICDVLLKEYEVTPEQCKMEVESHLNELSKKKLIYEVK